MAYRYTRADGSPGSAATIEALEAELRARLIAPDTLVHDDVANVRAKAAALLVFARKQAGARLAAPPATAVTPQPAKPAHGKPAAKAEGPAKAEKEPNVGLHQAIALGLVIVSVMVAGELGISPTGLSYLMQAGIAIMLVAVGVARIILGGKTPRKRIRLWYIGAGVFCTVMISAALVLPYFNAQREESEKQALKALAKTTREAITQLDTAEKGGKVDLSKLGATTSDHRSPLGRVAPLVQQMQAENVKDYAQFAEFETKSGIENILEPRTFLTRESRAADRQIFARYLAEFERLDQRRLERQARYRAEFAKVLGDGASARAFLAGVDGSLKERDALEAESLANHREMLKGIEALHAWIDSLSRAPTLDGGTLTFKNDSEVQRYTALLQKVGEVGKRQEALAEKQDKMNQDLLQRLEAGAEKGVRALK